MTPIFSRRLAFVGGPFIALVETARRWHQMTDLRFLPFWLDDWIIGALLVYGAWRSTKDGFRGRPALAAGWGFACGVGYVSVVSQAAALDRADPSGIAPLTVVAIKGILVLIAVLGLIGALRHTSDPSAP